MRRVLTVIAIILAVLILAGTVFYLTQRKQIDTLVTVVTVPEKELVRQRDEAQAALEEELADAGLDLEAIAQRAETLDLSEQADIPEDFSQLGTAAEAPSDEPAQPGDDAQTPDKSAAEGGGEAASPEEKASAEKAV
ncbi:MAG: hypothetical protein IJT18_02790, partial [Oscillospiraceae bacterium]|nr:hypothetical protein [Oscillospiraceae bacterium]